jgi:hypothetical protein
MSIMGADKLRGNLTNPAKDYLFDVIFPTPKGGGDTETLLLRCQSASKPSLGFGEIQVPYKQTGGTKYPGKVKVFSPWKLTFIEGEDEEMFKEFYTWAKSVVDPKTGIGTPKPDVATDITLSLITGAGEEYEKIILRGAWISELGEVTLDMSSEKAIYIPVTISYDYWESL